MQSFLMNATNQLFGVCDSSGAQKSTVTTPQSAEITQNDGITNGQTTSSQGSNPSSRSNTANPSGPCQVCIFDKDMRYDYVLFYETLFTPNVTEYSYIFRYLMDNGTQRRIRNTMSSFKDGCYSHSLYQFSFQKVVSFYGSSVYISPGIRMKGKDSGVYDCIKLKYKSTPKQIIFAI